MPHEVIMPALGMAQETGLIVAWLKRPGEAVKAGEALMEVETDKATMQVEAAADGWLADVRAGAGESVPVGEVVATIADSPGGRAGAPQATSEAAPEAVLPEGHEVFMPALGMSQDSGVVVAWHKDAGETVAVGEVLLEVETDKATMEVEAAHAGVLAAILAEAGDDVPVGQVIAVISETAPATPIRRGMAAARSAPERKPEAAPAEAASAPAPAETPAPKPAPAAKTGRILASPKARRLAAEAGLDLADLAAAGHAQPFHVADLAALKDLSQPTPAPRTGAASAAAPTEATADVPASGWDAFRDWHAADSGDVVPSGRMLAAFATGALRAATGAEGALTVAVGTIGVAAAVTDADRAPLAADLPEADAAPALLLRDLTGTALTGLRPGAAPVPCLTVARRGEALSLHLAHDAGALAPEAALALLDGVALRLADPRLHLL